MNGIISSIIVNQSNLAHSYSEGPKIGGESELAHYLERQVDAVVFGHSHYVVREQLVGLTLINPGVAGKRQLKVTPSIGLLELDPERIEGRILIFGGRDCHVNLDREERQNLRTEGQG